MAYMNLGNLGIKVIGGMITINGMLNQDMESIVGGFAIMYFGNTLQQYDLHRDRNEYLRDIAKKASDIEHSINGIDGIKNSLQKIVDIQEECIEGKQK